MDDLSATNLVILIKDGISKFWPKTLLLLLLGTSRMPVRCYGQYYISLYVLEIIPDQARFYGYYYIFQYIFLEIL
jgi:hypothetical protein